MIRCFLAIPVPAPVKEELAELQKALKPALPGAKWSHPSGLHITLKFLGEITREKVDAIKNTLNHSVIRSTPSFPIVFSGAGVFPNASRARVLWSGFSKGGTETTALAGSIDRYMMNLGFPREKKPFSAHITLARFREPLNVPANVLFTQFQTSEFTATEVVLFRSELKQSGAVYSPIEKIYLAERKPMQP